MVKKYLLSCIIFLSFFGYMVAKDNYVTASPKRGDGMEDIFKKYKLEANSANIKEFKALNQGKFDSKGGLILDRKYKLPIKIYEYNGKSVKTSLKITDQDLAKSIAKYNTDLVKNGIKPLDIKQSKEIWTPTALFTAPDDQVITKKSKKDGEAKSSKSKKKDEQVDLTDIKEKKGSNVYPILGEKYQNVKIIDKQLDGCVFYLVSGHGGPDPGAIGYREGNELHEHEYAYDVTLRMARKLLEHKATVYIIVQDPNDGIRDVRYLNNGGKEVLMNGDSIFVNQNARLKQRADMINELYEKHRKKSKFQVLVETHVDSRVTDKRIDIFFYHKPQSAEGKKVCDVVLETVRQKYDAYQPGRGYSGSVKDRNLFMLRNVKPIGVYIELGNIQNANDQFRLIEPNNRQAIANWISEGLVNAHKSKKIKSTKDDD